MHVRVQMIFRTSPTTNKARHFRRMYDKKVNVLGLSAVMGLPDAVLPSEVKAGLPQLMAGALTLLVRLRDQEVRPQPVNPPTPPPTGGRPRTPSCPKPATPSIPSEPLKAAAMNSHAALALSIQRSLPPSLASLGG